MALLRQKSQNRIISEHFGLIARHASPSRKVHSQGLRYRKPQSRSLAGAVYISRWRKTAGTLQGDGPETLPDHEEKISDASWKRLHQTGGG
jgi:hypothetical protein